VEAPYEQLLEALPSEAILNVDETGHKDNGKQHWTWCFRARLYTLFKIDPSRGSDVLLQVLGEEFSGVLGADYFSAYRKYMGDFGILVQFCLAHLIRDVKYLTTLSDKATRKYGTDVLDRLRRLFQVIHRPTPAPRRIWRSVSASMGPHTSNSLPRRGLNRPTTWPSRLSDLSWSTGASRRTRAAKWAADGPNASGPPSPPAHSRDNRYSTSFNGRFMPTSPDNPPRRSCLTHPDRFPVNGYKKPCASM